MALGETWNHGKPGAEGWRRRWRLIDDRAHFFGRILTLDADSVAAVWQRDWRVFLVHDRGGITNNLQVNLPANCEHLAGSRVGQGMGVPGDFAFRKHGPPLDSPKMG